MPRKKLTPAVRLGRATTLGRKQKERKVLLKKWIKAAKK